MGGKYSRDRAGNMSYLIYEDSAPYDPWLKIILGSTLALTLVMGIAFLPFEVAAGHVMFGG